MQAEWQCLERELAADLFAQQQAQEQAERGHAEQQGNSQLQQSEAHLPRAV